MQIDKGGAGVHFLAGKWFNVKIQLAKTNAGHIKYTKFQRICHQKKIVESSMQTTLVRHLNNLGIALHCEDP